MNVAAAYGFSLLTCDAVGRDPSGKITLYGIFDRISTSQVPTVHPMMAVYWKCRAPQAGRVGVTIERPDGSVLNELEPVESSRESPHVMQGTYTLAGFQFPVEGDYAFILRYNGSEVLRTKVTLAVRGAEAR